MREHILDIVTRSTYNSIGFDLVSGRRLSRERKRRRPSQGGVDGLCVIHSFQAFTQETLGPISIENNQILSREGNLNLISILCAVQKEIQN